MTTYTVYNFNSGTVVGRGLTVVQAAQEILSYDGHQYELRCEDHFVGLPPRWTLLVSRGSAASSGGTRGMTPAWSHSNTIAVYTHSEEVAWESIAEQVVRDMCVPLDVMRDDEFDRLQHELQQER